MRHLNTGPIDSIRLFLIGCSVDHGGRLGRGGRRNWKVETFEFGVDQLSKLLEWLGPIEEVSVYEECRSSGDSECARLRQIILHSLFQSGVREVLFKRRRVEADLFCILLQVVQLELLLIRKELVVKLPELTLIVCCFRRDRG